MCTIHLKLKVNVAHISSPLYFDPYEHIDLLHFRPSETLRLPVPHFFMGWKKKRLQGRHGDPVQSSMTKRH